MIDLGLRIERDAELPLHERRRGFLERGDAVIGVAAILELVDLALGDVAHERIGHVVIFTDAEIEQRPLRMRRQHRPLGPLDLLELVDLRALAVVDAADALGEEGLKPGIRGWRAHGWRGSWSYVGARD